MGKTHKDLKSNKKGFGENNRKPKRKMKPLSRDADKITGKRNELIWVDNDISQENVDQFNVSYGKRAKKIREELRKERKSEKTSARARLKKHLKDELQNIHPNNEQFPN